MHFFKKLFLNDSRDKLLFGEWNALHNESENVKMCFYPDGSLVYQIISNDKTQIMNLTYYTKNGFIAFDKHLFKLGDDEQTDIMMKLEMKY